eukprot:COSAG06_NODE_24520_length_660_cov_0.921569_1_plen_31_part_10
MLWEALQHGALLRVAAAKQAGLRIFNDTATT